MSTENTQAAQVSPLPTPRTDQREAVWDKLWVGSAYAHALSHAKDLERESAALKQQAEALVKALEVADILLSQMPDACPRDNTNKWQLWQQARDIIKDASFAYRSTKASTS